MTKKAKRSWLVVTIDTEEEGLWSGNYSEQATVENIASIPRFQKLCDRFGIRPTYLITTPVAESPPAVQILRTIQDDGRCEIGTHVHPWNSPPNTDATVGRGDSYLCNLAPDLQHAKIEQLTNQIELNFGRRPVSFRAGRYGTGTAVNESLRQLGYQVDSSVLPRADYRSENGPDFRSSRCVPYFPNSDDFLSGGGNGSLLEIPVTCGYTHRKFELADRMRAWAMQRPWKDLHAVGMLDRLGIATKVKLSPEQASLKQMQQLARSIINRGIPILVLMFHSSSLLPGCSPYVKTPDDLERFLLRLEQFFSFVSEELLLESLPLGECYQNRNELTGSN